MSTTSGNILEFEIPSCLFKRFKFLLAILEIFWNLIALHRNFYITEQ